MDCYVKEWIYIYILTKSLFLWLKFVYLKLKLINSKDHARYCAFVVVKHWTILLTPFEVMSQALGQSFDYPSACEALLNDMDK